MIAVLDYGIGNLRSAEKALRHVGADARLVTRPEEAADAAGVVLPGVGAFGACARALSQSGLDAVVFEAVAARRPLLAVCVGMQLLFEGSEESPGTPGLGLLAGKVVRLGEGVKRPQMQWNLVTPVRHRGGATDGLSSPPLLEVPEWFYFVHGYAAEPERTDDLAATCDYGGILAAAVARDNLFATQFHPEKSGRAGLGLLARFAERCRS